MFPHMASAVVVSTLAFTLSDTVFCVSLCFYLLTLKNDFLLNMFSRLHSFIQWKYLLFVLSIILYTFLKN